jgi:hypothetical protein
MVVQGTQKMVVMGRHDFKNEALIKRWRASQKMNVMGEKLKDEKRCLKERENIKRKESS